MAIIAAFGIVAERQTAATTRHVERAEVAKSLEAAHTALQKVIERDMEVLAGIAGAAAAHGELNQEIFDTAAKSIAGGETSVDGLFAINAATGEILKKGWVPVEDEFFDQLEHNPEGQGTRFIRQLDHSAILLWTPVWISEEDGTRQVWGHVAGTLNTRSVMERVGFAETSPDLRIMLTTARPSTTTGPGLAPIYGSRTILAEDPVQVDVSVPGGEWTLFAMPAEGWTFMHGTVQLIRVLTLSSVLLVGGLMLYTRRLTVERQKNIEMLRQREARIVETTSRLDVALDSLRIGVWEYDPQTRKVYWDVRMRELYDLSDAPRHLDYSVWRAALHPDDRDEAEKTVADAFNGRKPYNTQYRIVRPDGTVRHVRAKARACVQDGYVTYIGVNWDITESVQRKKELERRRREVDENNEAKSRFLATISHEIRTPMNGVLGILDLMLHDELSPAQRERASIVQGSAKHLLSIVNDLLDMSRLESERVKLFPAPVDIRRMSEEAVSLLANIETRDRIRMTNHATDAVPELIMCDPVRIRQVIMNLVSNALKYTDAGQIDVRLDYEAHSRGILRVSVKDTGIGIAPDAQKSLFERYAQVDSENARKRGGTGLGLAICRELVELMGGGITLKSEPGKGSEFSFWIPAEDASKIERDEDKAEDSGAAAVGRSAKRGARVLVAEDNIVTQKVLAGYLEMAGHEATFVTSGLDAMTQAKKGSFDLVFMDIEMPILDGFNATRLIRKLDAPRCDIPVIPMTETDDEDFRCARSDLGLRPAVRKPVSLDDLYDAMEEALAECPKTEPFLAQVRRPVPQITA
ncbi:ATP-binding protein [Amaricoccus tamworthensis]|uniref:ATP-binding protein n=1 Tax=Amaricoccus tamworthensis TaxID=57002 RepID=UPI003C7D5BC5